MDKQSGVYLTITDNSFQTGGTANVRPIVMMLTTKGEIGMNYVTAATYKDIVGYDVEYNSNYYGLAKILESVSYAYVWRLNQNAKLANSYFTSTATDKESNPDAETFEDIVNSDTNPILAIANKSVGNSGTTAVKFTPAQLAENYVNQKPTGTAPQTILIEDASVTETITIDGVEVKNGCILYNSTNTGVIAVIKPDNEDNLKVYKVVDGELIDDVVTIETRNIWSDGTNFYNGEMQISTEPEGDPSEPVALGAVRQSTYTTVTDDWNIGANNYNEDLEPFVPEGTRGSATAIGEVYIANGTETNLTNHAWYATNDLGQTYYQITKLGNTWEDCTKAGVTNTDAVDELAALYANSSFSNLNYYPYTNEYETGMYKSNSGSWYKVVAFTPNIITTQSVAEENQLIIDALDAATDIDISYIQYSKEILTTDNSIGTAEWSAEGNVTLILTAPPSNESFWSIRRIPNVIKKWNMTISSLKDERYSILSTVLISTNPDDEEYWENIELDDLQLFISGDISSNWTTVREYFTIDNGSNGDNEILASNMDLTPLETTPGNMIATNGITNYKIINRVAAKAEKYFIHTFADCPAYMNYIELSEWRKNIYASQYLVLGARPDTVEISEGKEIFVYPSVNYMAIYSNMLSSYQSLCYPPAGVTYGTISVEKLMDCDYENFGDELKTNRINWQRALNVGTVMWEQRTTYSLNTDLSYIAPTFIVDEVREQLLTFEQQFTFRYASPTDLLNQQSGMDAILSDLVTKGFLYSYKIDMPTYEEAQKAGRTLTIPIEIVITKDSEIININVSINNAA